jgi:uncharacterized protein YqeY
MSTHNKIREDLTVALKNGAKDRAGVLRLLLAELHNKEKEKPADKQSLTEEETIAVLKKEVKKRKEAAELYRKGKREDLAKKEEGEIAVIGEYLPPELGVEEVKSVVGGLIEKGFKDFNSLIRESMKELKGRADGRIVSEVIKEKLGNPAPSEN